MRQSIGLQEIGHITKALIAYNDLFSIIQQNAFNTPYKEACIEYMKPFMKEYKSGSGSYIDANTFSEWTDVNLHVVKQIWGSTSRGWGGIGGAAMTSSYTIVLENTVTRAIAVFYDGKLAYIAKNDEKLEQHRAAGYKILPGRTDCDNRLTIIYKPVY